MLLPGTMSPVTMKEESACAGWVISTRLAISTPTAHRQERARRRSAVVGTEEGSSLVVPPSSVEAELRSVAMPVVGTQPNAGERDVLGRPKQRHDHDRPRDPTDHRRRPTTNDH